MVKESTGSWLCENGLLLNENKTQDMWFSLKLQILKNKK